MQDPHADPVPAQRLWEARYLLARIEGEVMVAANAGWPIRTEGQRIQLLRAAEDLEHAAELLDQVGIRLPPELLNQAREWGLIRWLSARHRSGLLANRDDVIRLEGAVAHRLQAMGADQDKPTRLEVSDERRDRASYRRGNSAKVTAAG